MFYSKNKDLNAAQFICDFFEYSKFTQAILFYLSYLFSIAKPKNTEVCPSRETIAKNVGCSVVCVAKFLQKFNKQHPQVLSSKQRWDSQNNKHKSNVYFMPDLVIQILMFIRTQYGLKNYRNHKEKILSQILKDDHLKTKNRKLSTTKIYMDRAQKYTRIKTSFNKDHISRLQEPAASPHGTVFLNSNSYLEPIKIPGLHQVVAQDLYQSAKRFPDLIRSLNDKYEHMKRKGESVNYPNAWARAVSTNILEMQVKYECNRLKQHKRRRF